MPASLRATFSKEVPNYDLLAQAKPSISATTETGKNHLQKIILIKLVVVVVVGVVQLIMVEMKKELIFQLLKVLIGKKLD